MPLAHTVAMAAADSMVDIACPACHRTQHVAKEAPSHCCPGCGQTWLFRSCENCKKVAQIKAEWTQWKCLSCGYALNSLIGDTGVPSQRGEITTSFACTHC